MYKWGIKSTRYDVTDGLRGPRRWMSYTIYSEQYRDLGTIDLIPYRKLCDLNITFNYYEENSSDLNVDHCEFSQHLEIIGLDRSINSWLDTSFAELGYKC